MKEKIIRSHCIAAFLGVLIFFLLAGSSRADDHSGTIYNDTTWYAIDNPHVIIGNITIPDTVTLTLQDGVEVQFNSNLYMNISGTLTAVGTPGTGILFTRSGASNGYAMQFTSGGRGTFAHCTIEHLTYGIYAYSGTDTISVSHSMLQNNNRGVYALGGTVELSSDTLANNADYGFYGDDITLALLDGNNVFENNPTGIYIRDVSGVNLITGGNGSQQRQSGDPSL